MNRRAVGIDVWRGRAYLPVQARTTVGLWIDIEPVYEARLQPEELRAAVEAVLAAGHPQVPHPTQEEWRRRPSPILTATGARSWKDLARTGASYSIDWTEDQIRIDMSRLDAKGRWEWDPEKAQVFPRGTPLEDLMALILADIESRPELSEPSLDP